MKRITRAVALLSLMALTAHAEPVFMPQAASVVKQKQLETGIYAQYGYQKSELRGTPGTTSIDRVWQVPAWARYGITDNAETHLLVPYVSAVDKTEGTSSTRHADSGLGNMQVGAKWNFMPAPMPLAVGLDLDLPTANSANNPAMLGERYSTQGQQGFNTHLYIVGDTPMIGELVTGHAMFGYMNTATYTSADKTRFNPSDLLTFGVSLDFDLKKWISGFSVSGEFLGNTGLNHAKSNGTDIGNDKGTVLEAGPAMRYQMGSWRTQAGVLIDEGNATFRAYNYRLLFGISYLCGGSR